MSFKSLQLVLRNNINNKSNFFRIASNTSWLVLDKGARMLISILVGAWIARYLGPGHYGTWSYVVAYIAIFNAIATLGIDGIVINDLIRNPSDTRVILGSSLVLRLISGLVVFVLAFSILAFVINSQNQELPILIGILGISFLLQPFDVLDLFFQSQLTSRHTVIARLGALLVASGLRILAILSAASLVYFGVIQVVELAIGALLLIFLYQFTGNNILRWEVDLTKVRNIFRSSYGLIADSFLVVVTMQIDKIMIAYFSNDREVGLYATATSLSQLWYFIPVFIGTSTVPFLTEAFHTNKIKYTQNLKRILRILTYCALLISLCTFALSKYVVELLFGEAFLPAAIILSIHVWCCLFVFHISIRSRSLVLENKSKYVGIFSVIMTSLNVGFNLILIPYFGGVGAAIGSLLAWSLSATVVPLMFPGMRKYVTYFFNSFTIANPLK